MYSDCDSDYLLSDDEIDNICEYDKKLSRHRNNCRLKKNTNSNRNKYSVVICVDLDMTLIDNKGNPFPSVFKFGEKLRGVHNKTYIIINTLASTSHAVNTLPSTKIKYDMLLSNGIYGKPISIVRSVITDIDLLTGPCVMIDDKSFNLTKQYDIEINVSKYFRRNVNNTVYDIDYDKIIKELNNKLDIFWRSKKI